MKDLVLYYRPTCPYCRKVLDFMESKGIELSMKDVTDENLKLELINVGGRSQVPCLAIDGQAMYESDDIITWLDSNN